MTWWCFAFQVSTGTVVAGSDRLSLPMDRLPGAGSRLNTDGSFTVDVAAALPGGSLDVAPFLVPWKYGLGIACGGTVLAAGPITGRVAYDPDDETWTVPCGGLGALLSRKRLLNHSGAVTYTGPSLGHLARQAVAATLARPGGGLPLDLPPAASLDPGTGAVHTRTYPVDQPIMVGRAVEQLAEADGGPEWEYRPYFPAGDTTALRFQLRIGTPKLTSPGAVVHEWTATGPEGVLVSAEPGAHGDRVADNYYVPGQSGGTFVMGSSTSSVLREAGYPLLDDVDTTHTSVTVQATADAYAVANRSAYITGARTLDTLVRRSRVLGEVVPGDLVRVPLRGYLGYPDATHYARVLGLHAVDEETMAAELQVLLSLDDAYPAVPRRRTGRTDELRDLRRILDEQVRRAT